MKGFFGYYIKNQAKDGTTVSIIFGKTHETSFIQIITADNSHYIDLAGTPCHVIKRKFGISIGNNTVDSGGIFLDITHDGIGVSADIKFGDLSPLRGERRRWKRHAGSSIMGPFRYLPFMECKHMIVSNHHTLSGHMTIRDSSGDKTYDFTNGIGYIEGDHGKSFPTKYFWTQAHYIEEHAPSRDIHISASVARIPYLGARFTGTICNILYNGKQHRLATYRGARVKRFDQDGIAIKQRGYVLYIEVLGHNNSLPLLAPTRGKMSRTIHESVQTTIRYKLTHKNQTLFDFTTNHATHEFSDIKQA